MSATHLCQPLDVAAFRPAKPKWCNILDMGHKESRSKENLPKNVLPTLLSKLMNCLKSSNLAAGVWASGIHPFNRNEVLKRIPLSNQVEDVKIQVLNDFLQENCGVEKQAKSSNRKRWRKMKPGGRIVDIEKEPCWSQSSKKKKKTLSPKRKAPNYVNESENEDEEWRCYDWEEAWDENWRL